MARKLKTYQTSLGFFDLAIAAPSMRAALDAWGADSNLFHQGAGKESDDPDVIAAAMEKPGVVLRRPVGSLGSFGEHAKLPTDLADPGAAKAVLKPKGLRRRPSSRPVDKEADRKAASPSKRSVSGASVNGRAKRPPGRRSVNAVSRPSTRHRLRWKRPNGSTRRGSRPSKPRSTFWRRDPKPKMPGGIRKGAIGSCAAERGVS